MNYGMSLCRLIWETAHSWAMPQNANAAKCQCYKTDRIYILPPDLNSLVIGSYLLFLVI